MRVIADASTLRRPAAGTQRWVTGLLDALAARPEIVLRRELGPARLGNGWRWRVPNMARQRWWYEFGVRQAARHWHADVMLMPANLTARRGSIPQVVSLLDVNFLTSPGTYEDLFVRYALWSWRRAVRDAARITTISEFSRGELCRHLGVEPGQIDVVYPGVAAPSAPSITPPPHDRPYALFVGATEPHKNVPTLLDAWSGVTAPAGLDLAIVGRPGRAHASIAQRAARLGGRVHVVGSVTDEGLDSWYRGARVLLMPSLSEGFGYPPLEAMLRGVPVVASTGGSLPEVLGNAALLHEPRDVSRLVALVEVAAEEGAKRSALIAAGFARASEFSWSRAATSMATILATAVGG